MFYLIFNQFLGINMNCYKVKIMPYFENK